MGALPALIALIALVIGKGPVSTYGELSARPVPGQWPDRCRKRRR
jgi:hypothetical protein